MTSARQTAAALHPCLAVLCALGLVAFSGCAERSPGHQSPQWKMGMRRGEGVDPTTLHQQFLLAHRLATGAALPQDAQADPSYLLAESLWFAGDLDFAAAVKREPVEVRRSIARYVVISDLRPNFPRTYQLLAPFAELVPRP